MKERCHRKAGKLPQAYRLDLVVAGEIVVEIKAVEQLLPIHRAQLITYLRLSGVATCLLVNFHSPTITFRRLTKKTPFPVFPFSCDPNL